MHKLLERRPTGARPDPASRPSPSAVAPSPAQLLQDRANAGPHVRQLSAIGRLLNGAAPRAAPVQAPLEGVVQPKLKINGYRHGTLFDDVDDEDVEKLLEHLEDYSGFPHSSLADVKTLIGDSATYTFADVDHLWEWLSDPDAEEPEIDEDMDLEGMVDDTARKFGSTFKGKHIPFSGSTVYAVGHSQGSQELWAMQNSATGYIPRAKQDVVKKWKLNTDLPVTFPRNTKAGIEAMGKKRPTVMMGNAHAETNELLQHTNYSLRNKHSPHDVGLTVASDIPHCVECYWAGNAMMQKGTGTFNGVTGTENKLFARWREPWDGFYKEYGDNPFRDKQGNLRGNLTTGTYDSSTLDSLLPPRLKGLYD